MAPLAFDLASVGTDLLILLVVVVGFVLVMGVTALVMALIQTVMPPDRPLPAEPDEPSAVAKGE